MALVIGALVVGTAIVAIGMSARAIAVITMAGGIREPPLRQGQSSGAPPPIGRMPARMFVGAPAGIGHIAFPTTPISRIMVHAASASCGDLA
jgi:hypothetical protein